MPLVFKQIPSVISRYQPQSLSQQDMAHFASVSTELWKWVNSAFNGRDSETKIKIDSTGAWISLPGESYKEIGCPHELGPSEKKYAFVTDGMRPWVLQHRDTQSKPSDALNPKEYHGVGGQNLVKWAMAEDKTLSLYRVTRRSFDGTSCQTHKKTRLFDDFLGVDLSNIRHHPNNSLTDKDKVQVFRDIAVQLSAIRHMDVKLENMTMQIDQDGRARGHLIDLDLPRNGDVALYACDNWNGIPHTGFGKTTRDFPDIQHNLFMHIKQAVDANNHAKVNKAMEAYDIYCLAYGFHENQLYADGFDALFNSFSDGRSFQVFDDVLGAFDKLAQEKGYDLCRLEEEISRKESFISSEMQGYLQQHYQSRDDLTESILPTALVEESDTISRESCPTASRSSSVSYLSSSQENDQDASWFIRHSQAVVATFSVAVTLGLGAFFIFSETPVLATSVAGTVLWTMGSLSVTAGLLTGLGIAVLAGAALFAGGMMFVKACKKHRPLSSQVAPKKPSSEFSNGRVIEVDETLEAGSKSTELSRTLSSRSL